MDYKITKYPDGTSYIDVTNFVPYVTFRINTYEDLHHLEQLVDVYNHNGYPITVTITCMIDGQADKRFDSKQSSGLKLVTNRLSNMDANFIVFHPHNAEVIEASMNCFIMNNSNYVDTCFDDLFGSNPDMTPSNTVMLLPDGGAYKWGVKLADELGWQGDVVAAAKNRQMVDGKSKLVQQLPDYDFTGKHVIIVDDISIGGGTFKGLSTKLKPFKPASKTLIVSHMTVQNLGEDPVTNYFDNVYTSNSKYDDYYIQKDGIVLKKFNKPNNLEIIKLFDI